MRRVLCTEFSDAITLRVIDEPTPAPARGEALVAVRAAAATFVDGLIARGRYQLRPELPYVPGTALAGHVCALGPATSGPPVGSAVAAVRMDFGCYTSHAVLPAASLVALPGEVEPETAASAVENYSTVVYAVTHRVSIAPGEQVVVLGAGGGIGLASVDVARSLGARVVAVASSGDKRAAATAAGASVAIDYRELKDTIRSVTGGDADVVIDPVGGPAAEAALRALATGGRFCVLGFASGEIPKLPANIVLLRNRAVVGVDWGDWARADEDRARDLLADVVARIARGEIAPPSPRMVPLEEAADVLRAFTERRAVGKYVLRP